MVGRFIEKEDVRLAQEQFCQFDPHLPAAAELPGITFEILERKPQSGRYLPDPCLQIVALPVFKPVLKLAHFIGQDLQFPLRRLPGNLDTDLMDPVLQEKNVIESGLQFPV